MTQYNPSETTTAEIETFSALLYLLAIIADPGLAEERLNKLENSLKEIRTNREALSSERLALSEETAKLKALKAEMKPFLEAMDKIRNEPAPKPEEARQGDENGGGALSIKVEDLELSTRSQNCLKHTNILSVADLVQVQETQLIRMPNCGRKCIAEIKEVLINLDSGLTLGMPPPAGFRKFEFDPNR